MTDYWLHSGSVFLALTHTLCSNGKQLLLARLCSILTRSTHDVPKSEHTEKPQGNITSHQTTKGLTPLRTLSIVPFVLNFTVLPVRLLDL